jgi:hypothetical protein
MMPLSSSSPSFISACVVATLCFLSSAEGFGMNTTPSSSSKQQLQQQHSIIDSSSSSSRRSFLSKAFTKTATTSAAILLSIPQLASARYVLNEETGEYDEVTDEDWQTTWKKRLDKAQSMGTEDVFLAAQGAGNLDLKDGSVEESESSKKRRAMAGCRNDRLRGQSGVDDVKVCTKRVLSGDYQFMIDVM